MSNILLIDDEEAYTEAAKAILEHAGYTVTVAASVAEAKQAHERTTFDLQLVDLALPDGSGMELLGSEFPRAVIVTGHPSIETAVRAMKRFVVDYLIKPLDSEQLLACLENALPQTPGSARKKSDKNPGDLIGNSESMRNVYDLMERYADSDGTVLIVGESGTGKELIARGIHQLDCPDKPFVAVNCGAIPAELIASELFGHEKGAFTGAAAKRLGHFQRAEDGVIFLDEITELPAQQQVALLRVLENRTVTPVGSEKEVPVNARVVAASNRDLETMVADGDFREDLYYRLMVLPIRTPALRERPDDIPLLANHFLAAIAKQRGNGPETFSSGALERLQRYRWPGNVRELKHLVLRASVLANADTVIDALPDDFERPLNLDVSASDLPIGVPIKDVERQLIEKTLAHFDGNKKPTAEALGISLKTLYNRLNEYELSS